MSRTGGGGAAVPYGEQRYNEHLHLLAWTPKDSRTKLYANKALLRFYRSWNVSGAAAAVRVNGFYYSRLTRLSISLNHVTKMMALSLKISQRHSQVDIRHQGSTKSARTAEARALCLTLHPLICLADPGVELYIDCCRPENPVAAVCLRADAVGDTVHQSTTCCQGWNRDLAKLGGQR